MVTKQRQAAMTSEEVKEKATNRMTSTQKNMALYLPVLTLVFVQQCDAFTPSHPGVRSAAAIGGREQLQMLPHETVSWASSTLNTAVDIFDGSGVDPVVVSDVFWSRLQANFLSVLIGNFLAAVVFAFIMSQVSSQLSKLGSFVTENIFKGKQEFGGSRVSSSTFQRADAPSPARVDIDVSKLLLCIAIDVIGSASELVPVLGELTDVVWAPIAGLALRSLYGSNVLFALEFAEEILPFTDILPLATLCWVIDTFFADSDLAKTLGLGVSNQNINGSSNVIDVEAYSDANRKLSESDPSKRR